jgi:ATP-dependent DNA helicase RecG
MYSVHPLLQCPSGPAQTNPFPEQFPLHISRSIYYNAFIYVQSKLNTEFIIKGGPRQERIELPEEALREALLNAIAHRDYFVRGASILVEVFSDRVEITNPGGLVKGMTLEDLGRRSLSRNNLLFGLMQRMDLIEKAGSGITRMRYAMKDYGLEGPGFDVNDNWFTIIFDRPGTKWSEKPAEVLSKTDMDILELIRIHPETSRKRIAEDLGLSEYRVRATLEKLKLSGMLKRVGPDKGGYWLVKEVGLNTVASKSPENIQKI